MLALLLTGLLCASGDEPPKDKLRMGISYRAWGRNVRYGGGADGVSQAVGLEHGAAVDVQWFPAAYFTDARGSDVGVTLRADFAPVVAGELGGHPYDTSVSRIRTGVMFRWPLKYVEPSAHLGFNVFEATTAVRASDGTPRPRFPNVTTQGPRVGLGLRLVELWRVTLDAGLGATWVVSTGELGTSAFFPGAHGGSYDGWLGISLRLWPFLDLRIGVDAAITSLALGGAGVVTDTSYGATAGLVFKGVP